MWSALIAAALLSTEPAAAPPSASTPPETSIPRPGQAGQPLVPEAKLVSAAELMNTTPVVVWDKVGRAWVVEHTGNLSSLLVELTGPLPMHHHPDGDHRIYLIQGDLELTVGDQTRVMHPGDYWVIPRGVRHRLAPKKGTRVLYGSVDLPAVDAKKTVWIEPAPKVIPAKAVTAPK